MHRLPGLYSTENGYGSPIGIHKVYCDFALIDNNFMYWGSGWVNAMVCRTLCTTSVFCRWPLHRIQPTYRLIYISCIVLVVWRSEAANRKGYQASSHCYCHKCNCVMSKETVQVLVACTQSRSSNNIQGLPAFPKRSSSPHFTPGLGPGGRKSSEQRRFQEVVAEVQFSPYACLSYPGFQPHPFSS